MVMTYRLANLSTVSHEGRQGLKRRCGLPRGHYVVLLDQRPNVMK